MELNAAPNLPKTPNNISQKAHEKPADRDAHCVSAMTPLFCENVVLGRTVMSAERNEAMPSASRPPWMRESSCPSSSTREASADAEMSPMDSTVVMMKARRVGMMAGG